MAATPPLITQGRRLLPMAIPFPQADLKGVKQHGPKVALLISDDVHL